MSKIYTTELLGDEARAKLRAGIKRVAEPVSRTIGAKGRNAVFLEYNNAKPTNDGVSIARRIQPQDEYEYLGAQMIKEVAERTVREAGDGTTSSIVVADAITEEAEKAVLEGKSPMQLRAEMEEAKKEVIEKIKEMATPITTKEEILNVARVSVEDEEMAQMVADAIERAGKHGAVVVEEGSGYGLEKEDVRGYHWDRGYVSPYMVTNMEKREAVLEDVPVIVTDRFMNLNRDLMSTLNELAQKGIGKALVIVDRMEGELLQSAIANKLKGTFTCVVVPKPPTNEELEDIAALVGGTAITKDKNIKAITGVEMGFAKKVIVSKDKTTILADGDEALAERVESLTKELADMKEKHVDGEARDLIVQRLAKLSDGMVLIRVGAKTEAERRYKKDKMDDAVAAAKAATEEGIVPGGGVALLTVADAMTAKTDGAKILKEALKRPYEKILENAGIKNTGAHYNVKTGKVVKDMVKEGIIDPAKVTRSVVENAVSFAGTFITIESAIADFVIEENQ